MLGRIKEKINSAAHIMWSHRGTYAGLAGAYGGLCFGVDKELVQQVIEALYVALVLKG